MAENEGLKLRAVEWETEDGFPAWALQVMENGEWRDVPVVVVPPRAPVARTTQDGVVVIVPRETVRAKKGRLRARGKS